MNVSEFLRIDYKENIRTGIGPLPPGHKKGHFFEPNNFWPMDNFLKQKGLNLFKEKALKLINENSIRKDFKMKQSNNTPRNMRVVPGNIINQDEEIMSFYRDPKLIYFLSKIIGINVEVYPDPLENIVITKLEGKGDRHGKHLDVPPVALIMCLEAPELDEKKYMEVKDSNGDVLQLIKGSDNSGGMLSFTNIHGNQQLHPMEPGDAYILRSDLMPHEVLPISEDNAKRTILNFTYGLEGVKNIPDGSVEALFT